jgi:hypothetical protein
MTLGTRTGKKMFMRWRSGVVGLVMEYSRRKDCWSGNPDGDAVDDR